MGTTELAIGSFNFSQTAENNLFPGSFNFVITNVLIKSIFTCFKNFNFATYSSKTLIVKYVFGTLVINYIIRIVKKSYIMLLHKNLNVHSKLKPERIEKQSKFKCTRHITIFKFKHNKNRQPLSFRIHLKSVRRTRIEILKNKVRYNNRQ